MARYGARMADRMLITGAAGTTLLALCCVTPLLPATLSALGLGLLVPVLWRDAVLLPLLGLFLLLTGYALWRRRTRSSSRG
ncbi:mercury resistance system transport protein MerF [Jannaschia ovalis]|uniref:Mercury resistance system transport protein MerF n=1 Tax=Jannaschia ovalis TaxID=3038773 RepID=A0ABY8L8Z1_9RHOB|nr:mercury resistance system transport protein MerF [Jannaschia sp. GRR-S6-38]WGH77827.1 mercury resistance system transport protein MerF [Jannaschia sp. GRR-S6-38]